VRSHKPDGAVVGNVGLPTFPGQWMQWNTPYFDAVMVEGFITYVDSTDYVVRRFPKVEDVSGFYNLIPGTSEMAATQPPGTPPTEDAGESTWPTMVAQNLRPFVDSGNRLITVSWISANTDTPPNTSPSSGYDLPPREDAFFAYGAAQLAGGVAWLGPVDTSHNVATYFGDLHQIALGAPVGSLVEFNASGQVQSGDTPSPVTTIGLFKGGVVAVNWTNDDSPVTFAQFQTIVDAALGRAVTIPRTLTLYDLFDQITITLVDSASTTIVPGTSPGNPDLPGQARIYLLKPFTLEQWPTPSNATSFGPSTPALPGGPFLYNWVSNDIFGTRFLTGPGGTEPFPWSG
jgi:hypothetical protein